MSTSRLHEFLRTLSSSEDITNGEITDIFDELYEEDIINSNDVITYDMLVGYNDDNDDFTYGVLKNPDLDDYALVQLSDLNNKIYVPMSDKPIENKDFTLYEPMSKSEACHYLMDVINDYLNQEDEE